MLVQPDRSITKFLLLGQQAVQNGSALWASCAGQRSHGVLVVLDVRPASSQRFSMPDLPGYRSKTLHIKQTVNWCGTPPEFSSQA